jgi:hypothetical protein
MRCGKRKKQAQALSVSYSNFFQPSKEKLIAQQLDFTKPLSKSTK